ncbi:MAG: hypothetical protein RH860_01215 [Cytophagales bacterium]
MEKLSKHPITIIILGSIITYILIPIIQEDNIKRKAMAEYELRLVNANNDIGFELYEMYFLFENFAWEVGNDSTLTEVQIQEIQDDYLKKSIIISTRINNLWFSIKNLKNELYLFDYHDKKDVPLIEEHFKLFYQGINNSIIESKNLVNKCLRDKNFKYDKPIQELILSRKEKLAEYDRIQFQHLNRICGILND